MKICVFSDIHGNSLAFESAYHLIMNESADVNLFLGDLCGYYFDEINAWHRLLEIPRLVALRGNHDEMFSQAAAGDVNVQNEYRLKYGPALDFFLEKRNADLINWINELPLSWEGQGATCSACHGSPWDFLKEYIYPDASLNRFGKLQYSWVFLGHTHYPMDLSEGSVRIVNPGSLGQPRDGHWPRYAVVDLVKGKVDFREVCYDREKLICEIRQRAPENFYLHDVIERINQGE